MTFDDVLAGYTYRQTEAHNGDTFTRLHSLRPFLSVIDGVPRGLLDSVRTSHGLRPRASILEPRHQIVPMAIAHCAQL